MNNYQDISNSNPEKGPLGARFEFYCPNCSYLWTTPIKPYRGKSFSAFVDKLMEPASEFFSVAMKVRSTLNRSGRLTQQSAVNTWKKHLEECKLIAKDKFGTCQNCQQIMCKSCVNSRSCKLCVGTEHSGSPFGEAYRNEEAEPSRQSMNESHALGQGSCKACGSQTYGARLCPDCGFDTASASKGCPACGSTLARSAKHCHHCGHSF
jgi:hypothetical protein